KGICYFSHEIDTCYIFDQAGRQISLRDAGQWYASMPAEELYGFLQTHPDTLRDWDENYGDRMQKIVFIGQHLDRRLICSELDKCLLDVFQ
ncbi:MAG: GTP-binding protein, partial [Bacteroidales bacterium]|nr:GTP-binding protein [Bacteroidales bacterium]